MYMSGLKQVVKGDLLDLGSARVPYRLEKDKSLLKNFLQNRGKALLP